MKSYDAVVFDLDGTLLDTSNGILASLEYVVDKFQLHKLTDSDKQSCIGPPIQDTLINLFQMSKDQAQNGAELFRNRYKDFDLYKAEVYKGVYELLTLLKRKGIKIGIATYKRNDYAIDIINHFNLSRFCDSMQGSDNENRLKKQDIIKNCIQEMKSTDLSKVVMIGDTKHDAFGAEEVGIDFIAVTYGFGFKTISDASVQKNIGCVNAPLEIIRFFK
jgi:phosphoglycolate phosphatase